MKEHFKKVIEHSTVRKIIITLGTISIVLVIFNAGMFVGYHKAQFSQARGDQFKRGFDDPKFFLAPFMHNKNNQNPHGTVGKILSVSPDSTILIESMNDVEQTVTISSTTITRYAPDATSTQVLKAGDYVAVIGKPNSDGGIDASLIRVIPAPQR